MVVESVLHFYAVCTIFIGKHIIPYGLLFVNAPPEICTSETSAEVGLKDLSNVDSVESAGNTLIYLKCMCVFEKHKTIK